MKLKHILSESILIERVSSIVFHATTFPAAVKILSADRMGKGKWDTEAISFTRSVHGRYHKNNRLIGIIFEFDGDMLNQNYKGKPTGTEYYDDDDEIEYRGKDNGQLEDRLYVGKKGIPNVSRYIKSAIVYVPKEYLDNDWRDEFGDEDYDTQLKSVKRAVSLLKDRNIPYTVVKSEKGLSKFRPKGDR
jgi:hypothetical protein